MHFRKGIKRRIKKLDTIEGKLITFSFLSLQALFSLLSQTGTNKRHKLF